MNPPVIVGLEHGPNFRSRPSLCSYLSPEITTILNFVFVVPLRFNIYILPCICVYNFFMDFKIVVSFKKMNLEYCFLSNDHIFSRESFIINPCK